MRAVEVRGPRSAGLVGDSDMELPDFSDPAGGREGVQTGSETWTLGHLPCAGLRSCLVSVLHD